MPGDFRRVFRVQGQRKWWIPPPAATGGMTWNISTSDNLGVQDPDTTGLFFRIANAFRIITDNLGVQDLSTNSTLFQRLANAFRQISDNLGVQSPDTNIQRVVNPYFRQISDNLGVQSPDTNIQRVVNPYFRQISDNLGLKDSALAVDQHGTITFDNLGMTDSTQRVANAFRIIADNCGLQDSVQRVVNPYFRQTSDNLGIQEQQVIRIVSFFRQIVDNCGLTDNAFAVLATGGVTWNVSTLDNLALQEGTFKRLANGIRQISDNCGLTDSIFRIANAFRQISDNCGLTDPQPSKRRGRPYYGVDVRPWQILPPQPFPEDKRRRHKPKPVSEIAQIMLSGTTAYRPAPKPKFYRKVPVIRVANVQVKLDSCDSAKTRLRSCNRFQWASKDEFLVKDQAKSMLLTSWEVERIRIEDEWLCGLKTDGEMLEAQEMLMKMEMMSSDAD